MSILLYGEKRRRSKILVVYFADSSRRGKKKIMEKEDYGKETGSGGERQG